MVAQEMIRFIGNGADLGSTSRRPRANAALPR
jgi:hypothetical protein